jgi:ABC-type multidrug transport system fused ATPase/permease subunit
MTIPRLGLLWIRASELWRRSKRKTKAFRVGRRTLIIEVRSWRRRPKVFGVWWRTVVTEALCRPMPDTPIRTYTQRELLRRLLAMAWQHRAGCMWLIAQQAALVLLSLAGLGGIGIAIDFLRHRVEPSLGPMSFPFGWLPPAAWSDMQVLGAIAGGVVFVALIRALLGYAAAITNSRLGQGKIVVGLRSGVYAKLQRLSFRFFDASTTGSLMNRVTSDTQAVRLFVDGVLVQSVNTVLAFACYLVCLLRIHPGLTSACLLPLPLVWLTVVLFAGWLRRDYQANRDLVDHLVLTFEELMRGIGIVKGFALEPWATERFDASNDAVRDQKARVFMKLAVMHPVVNLLNHLSMAVLLGYGGWLAVRGEIPLGTGLVVFAGVLQQLAAQVTGVAAIADNLQQTLTGAQRVFEILDTEPEVRDVASPIAMERARGLVEFSGVSFAFKENSTVLHDITLTVQPGERIAILGPTGAGKSALIHLIPRFYDPDAGTVRLDGRDLREWRLADVRQQVGLLFQESFLFSASVAANIAFGKPDATRAEIEQAATRAAAHEFIEQLPQGYDTLLHENGSNLSGGQRQRLALARALILDPAILILDDPTAAVDTETEAEILRGLDAAMKGRTCFIIAHRLGAVKFADRLVVLEEGRIVAMGTHAELSQRDGYYRNALLSGRPDVFGGDGVQ